VLYTHGFIQNFVDTGMFANFRGTNWTENAEIDKMGFGIGL